MLLVISFTNWAYVGALFPFPPTATSNASVTEPGTTEEAAGIESEFGPFNECLDCRLDQRRLMDTADPAGIVESESEGEGRGGKVPPLEAWQKVLLDGEAYLGTEHCQISCIDCHGGGGSSDKAAAHTNLVAAPSEDPAAVTAKVCSPRLSAAG